jgi:hypothetical protein
VTPRERLESYRAKGWRLLFLDKGTKGPSDKKHKGWTSWNHQPADFDPAVHSVGVFLGEEVMPGRFLIDVDIDWPGGMTIAKAMLPATGFGYGRASKLISHAFYYSTAPLKARMFQDVDGQMLCELRGLKGNGTVGLESMVPPSIHPSGEEIVVRQDGEPGVTDSLERRVVMMAVGFAFAKHLGPKGVTHDVRLALAGFLLRSGLNESETVELCRAIAQATGNDSSDAETAARSTAARLASGDKVSGGPTLAKAIGDRGGAVIRRIRGWIGEEEFATDDKGRPLRDSQENIRIALSKIGVEMSWDAFAGKPMVKREEDAEPQVLDDHSRNRLWLEIDEKFRFRPMPDFFDVVLTDDARSRPFHPVVDWLASLTWDGTPRLDGWLSSYGGAAVNKYVEAVGSIMLVAAVRRVRFPGVKFDEMPILESTQGLNKSSTLKALCAREEWFSDDLPLNIDAKQIIERTSGKWIIEAADLAGMGPSKVEALKAMLSRQVDGPVRMAYARLPLERSRHFIIIGTTNLHQYLKDITGNRRFWPVRVKEFDIERLRKDRDQLWAEAAARESSGYSIRLPRELWSHAEKRQEMARAEDPWEAAIDATWPDRSEKLRLPPNDIWMAIGVPIERRGRKEGERISEIMQKLGFRRMTVREGEKNWSGWGRDPLGFVPAQGQLSLDSQGHTEH